MADYLYITKTIEDDKIQLATKVELVDGIMLCEGKTCAVLKRYTLPADMAEVMADLQRFSAGAAPAASPKPEHKPVERKAESAPAPEAALKDTLLDQLASEFFRDCKQIYKNKPGNTPELRRKAMEQIGLLMASIPGAKLDFLSPTTRCPEPGLISYLSAKAGGEEQHSYGHLHRISAFQFDRSKIFFRRSPWHHKWPDTVDFLETAGIEIMFPEDENCLYLKEPMGIDGCFELRIVKQTPQQAQNGLPAKRSIWDRQRLEGDKKLKALGAVFFGGCGQILQDMPGNTPEIHLEAMNRISSLMEAACFIENGFTKSAHCKEAGSLSVFCFTSSDSCYDGGCYSSGGSSSVYCYLTRLTQSEYDQLKQEYGASGANWQNQWMGLTVRPLRPPLGEVFMKDRDHLCLKNPMGLTGYFQITIDR